MHIHCNNDSLACCTKQSIGSYRTDYTRILNQRARLVVISILTVVAVGITAYFIFSLLEIRPDDIKSPNDDQTLGSNISSTATRENTSSPSFLKNSPLPTANTEEALAVGQQDLTPAQLFEKTQRSVVQITDSSKSNPADSRLGSGFVYDTQGHIVTNYHVVQGGDRIDVTFLDGKIYRVKLIGADPYTDLAVLQVSDAPKDELIPLVMANSTQLLVGQPVAAIGNPFGLSGSMTTGIVSGVGRLIPSQAQSSNGNSGPFSIPDIIQTDASINPGNSGGPLLDMQGKVIGINSAIFSTTGEFAGVGFAISSNTISKVVPSLISTGSFQHPWLGISGVNMKPEIADAVGLAEPRGFLVEGVIGGSPAEKAGIRGGDRQSNIDGGSVLLGGDVIIKVDGKDVRKIDDILVYLQREKTVGDNIALTIIRDGKAQDIIMVLGARPDAAESP